MKGICRYPVWHLTHTCIDICIHAHIHTHTHMYKCTYVYIHKYIQTHVYMTAMRDLPFGVACQNQTLQMRRSRSGGPEACSGSGSLS